MQTPTATALEDLTPISRREAMKLAESQNRAFLTELRRLPPDAWRAPTDCAPWQVRDIAAHVLGWAEAVVSPAEMTRQVRRAVRRRGELRTLVDVQNQVQVEERRDLEPAELVRRLEEMLPRFLAMRRRLGMFLRPIPFYSGLLGFTSLGFVANTVFTRDLLVHRIDIARAVGAEPDVGPDEVRTLSDCLKEWARRSGADVTIRVAGPAGGDFSAGAGKAATVTGETTELCRILSGRGGIDDLVIEGDRRALEGWLRRGPRF